jgi:hypothetical protein
MNDVSEIQKKAPIWLQCQKFAPGSFLERFLKRVVSGVDGEIVQFRKQDKEHSVMEAIPAGASIGEVVQIFKGHGFTRAKAMAHINKRAAETTARGRTAEQRFADFLATGEGSRLFSVAKHLPGPDHIVAEVEKPAALETDGFRKLQEKATEIRKSNPSLTREQAFAKVYSDPANRELVDADRDELFTEIGKAFAAPPVEHPEPAKAPVPAMTPSLQSLYGMADEMVAKNPKLTRERAFAEAAKTADGKRLMRLYHSELVHGAHN